MSSHENFHWGCPKLLQDSATSGSVVPVKRPFVLFFILEEESLNSFV